MKSYIKVFLIACLGGALTLGAYVKFIDKPEVVTLFETQPAKFVNYNSSSDEGMTNFTHAAQQSMDAVVHVKTLFQSQKYYNPWSQFFGGQQYQSHQSRGSGSGVIIAGNGYIVTNNHVIANAEKVSVTLNDNTTFEATVVGTDPGTDLALLKIDAEGLPYLPMGDSDNLQVGEWVLAVGNPFNLTSTVTAGIVSAKARNINILEYDPANDVFPLESFIQTDAAVNPGNSGGALVNTNGELVGVNAAIASKTGSYSGYSFAIPASIVKKVTADLLEYGAVQRAYIGVSISNVTQDVADEKDLKSLYGAYVRGLTDNGAAFEAGLQEGDVIVKVAGIPVSSPTELQEQVGKYRPGDKITIEVLRNNKPKNFELVLRNRQGSTKLVSASEVKSKTNSVLGIELEELDEETLNKLNIEHGVRVKDVKSGKLSNSGIREGFVITHIDKQAVETTADVYKILSNKKGGILVEGVYGNGNSAYYGFGM